MREPDERLLHLAEEVSDEIPVDWASTTRDPANEGVPVRGLQLISRVAAAHREHLKSEAPTEPLFRWGPLQVIEEIGRGSYGLVYRAWDARLQTEVALKLRAEASEGSARAWLDEARRLARVTHPNVVRVLGADLHEGRAGIWMELLDGTTLAQKLDADLKISPREATMIGLDLCAALAAVHATGMVHGDVKPQNVAQTSDGRCVLLDFGSGRELESPSAPTSVTPVFTSPEVIEGQPTSVASDVYALGALLFRAVAGRAPVQAENWEELRDAHREGRAASLRSLRPDLPADFVSAIDRALRSDPKERHADMAAFERALDATSRPARSPGRSTVRWLVPLVAAAAVVLLVWSFARQSEPTSSDSWSSHGPAHTTIQAEANFFRVDGGSREPLGAGSRIQPGQQLRLEWLADRELHVYVLNEDVDGELFLLFPILGLELANPLPPETLHRMPGEIDGQSQDWLVTSAGGRERFLVVASAQPLAEFETVIAGVRPASARRQVQYPTLGEDDFTILRGVGGLISGDTGEWQGSRLAELTARLEGASAPHGDLWFRQVEFLNPRP